jgi:hypothetical protein
MKLLHRKTTGCFVVTAKTFDEFKEVQKDYARRDLLNMPYEVDFLIQKVKSYSTETLDKCISIAHKTILFSYYMNPSLNMSMVQALGLSEDRVFSTFKEVFKNKPDATITINKNGGYCSVSDNFDELEAHGYAPYEWVDSNIVDNNTMNLVLENAHETEEKLIERINSDISPSAITNFKHIYSDKKVIEFLTSRNDWCLWVYTQGADITLYKSFLEAYRGYIDTVCVYSSKIEIVDELSNIFTDIEFIKI